MIPMAAAHSNLGNAPFSETLKNVTAILNLSENYFRKVFLETCFPKSKTIHRFMDWWGRNVTSRVGSTS